MTNPLTQVFSEVEVEIAHRNALQENDERDAAKAHPWRNTDEYQRQAQERTIRLSHSIQNDAEFRKAYRVMLRKLDAEFAGRAMAQVVVGRIETSGERLTVSDERTADNLAYFEGGAK